MTDQYEEAVDMVSKIAEVSIAALRQIRQALDDDCDATRIALYNPRKTVAKIRMLLQVADEQLAAVTKVGT